MAGKHFLNPILKIILCALGMLVIGYYLVRSIGNNSIYDSFTILRILVIVGFAYLLVQSIRQLLHQRRQ